MIRRFHEAKINGKKEVTIWGTGTPRREFLHVDDLAMASIHVMNMPKVQYDALTEPMNSHLNVGYGSDISIGELAHIIQTITDFQGHLSFDHTKPDGVMRKLMDSSRLRSTGWEPHIKIEEGLQMAYQDFVSNHSINI